MRRFLVLLWLLSLALAAPRLVVEPEDGVKPLLDLIASAREEILVKMYLWTPSRMDVVEALGEAARRGVRVRVLLEREPSGGRVDLEVFQALKARGVEVRLTTPFRFVFVHEKSLVVDRKRAWVGTMNLTGSSFAANREYALILDDPAQVAEIAKVFEADWEGERLDLSQALLVWAPSRVLGGVKEGNARETLLALIRGAQRELFLEHQAMADPEVEAALKEALGRGVRVRLLGSPKEPGDTYFLAGALRLKEAGALVRFLPDPYVHAKVLVRDGEEALLGSLNLSANSIQANRELAVRFTAREAPEAFRRLLFVMEGDWEKALPENPFGGGGNPLAGGPPVLRPRGHGGGGDPGGGGPGHGGLPQVRPGGKRPPAGGFPEKLRPLRPAFPPELPGQEGAGQGADRPLRRLLRDRPGRPGEPGGAGWRPLRPWATR